MEYLLRVLKSPFRSALRLFIIAFAVYSLLMTLLAPSSFLTSLQSFCRLPQILKSHYPSALVIEIKEGQAVTSVMEPYTLILPLPADVVAATVGLFGAESLMSLKDILRQSGPGSGSMSAGEFGRMIDRYLQYRFPGKTIPPVNFTQSIMDNGGFDFQLNDASLSHLIADHLTKNNIMLDTPVLTIDTRAKPEDIRRYRSLMILTRDALVKYNYGGDPVVTPLSEFHTQRVTSTDIRALCDTLERLTWLIPETKMSLFFVFFATMVISGLSFTLFSTLALAILARLSNYRAPFKTLFAFCLHMNTIVLVAAAVLYWLSVPGSYLMIPAAAGTVGLGLAALSRFDPEILEGPIDPLAQRLKALYACNDPDVVKSVLSGNPDLLQGRGDDIPLLYYARSGNQSCLKAVLDVGFNIDSQNSRGESALHIAVKESHTNIVRMLLERGANSRQKTLKGTTPLHLAAVFERKDIIRLLLEKGARPDWVSTLASGNEAEIAKYVEQDAKLVNHSLTEIGCFPLHCAVFKKNAKLVKYLLDRGAVPDVMDDEGLTPLAYARRLNDSDIVTLLHTQKNPPPAGDSTETPPASP